MTTSRSISRSLLAFAVIMSVAILSVSVDGQQARAPRTERAVPFAAGERLEYDVSWSSYLSAGSVVLSVAEKRPSLSSVAYYIVAEATPSSLVSKIYTLYYKADTLLDAYSLLPQRGSVFTREGKRQRMKITSFDHGAKKARFDLETASKVTIDMTIPPATQDFVSAIYALRAGALKPGDRTRMTVADSGHLYQIEFAVVAAEPFTLGGAHVPSLRIVPTIVDDEGQPVAPGSTLWVTSDARHVPLRLEAPLTTGRFVLSLRQTPAR